MKKFKCEICSETFDNFYEDKDYENVCKYCVEFELNNESLKKEKNICKDCGKEFYIPKYYMFDIDGTNLVEKAVCARCGSDRIYDNKNLPIN